MKQITYLILFVIAFSIQGCKLGSGSISPQNRELVSAYEQNKKKGKLCTGWYSLLEDRDKAGFVRKHEGTDDVYTINPFPIIIAKNIISTTVAGQGDHLRLDMQFNEFGTSNWSTVTSYRIDQQLVFIIDDVIVAASMVRSHITSGVASIGYKKYSINDYEGMKEVIDRQSKE